MRVVRKYGFSASHRLHAKELDERQNQEVFGKCNNPFGHGHNYELEVMVSGPVDPRTGLTVERARLDAVVRDAVLSRVRHRNLNCDVAEFRELVPTTENLAAVIFAWLRAAWPGDLGQLESIRITETPRNIFEVSS